VCKLIALQLVLSTACVQKRQGQQEALYLHRCLVLRSRSIMAADGTWLSGFYRACQLCNSCWRCLLSGHALLGRNLVWLLLRLATPDNFHSLIEPNITKQRVATLQRACMAYSPWQQQLQQATDRELAVLLAVGADAPQWMLFLAETGRAVGIVVPLVEAVCWSKQEFGRQLSS
jgi:hypothetical protein